MIVWTKYRYFQDFELQVVQQETNLKIICKENA